MTDEEQVYFSHRHLKLVVRVAHKLYYGSTLYIIMRSAENLRLCTEHFINIAKLPQIIYPASRGYIFAGLVGV